MAVGETVPTDGARAGLEGAVGVLNELGGLAELEEHDGGLLIRGYSCPLSGVTPEHPEVCRMVETLIAEVAGVAVHELCDRGEKPRCRFEIASDGDTAAQRSCGAGCGPAAKGHPVRCPSPRIRPPGATGAAPPRTGDP